MQHSANAALVSIVVFNDPVYLFRRFINLAWFRIYLKSTLVNTHMKLFSGAFRSFWWTLQALSIYQFDLQLSIISVYANIINSFYFTFQVSFHRIILWRRGTVLSSFRRYVLLLFYDSFVLFPLSSGTLFILLGKRFDVTLPTSNMPHLPFKRIDWTTATILAAVDWVKH